MPGPQHASVRQILRGIRQIEKLLCISAFTVLIVVVFADVVSRELTGAGLYWASQTGVWANIVVVMAGFGLASADGAHLRPRFTDSWLPARWSPGLEFLQQLVMSLFCVAAGLVALSVVLDSVRLGEVSIDLYLPVWPVQALLPGALFTAAIRHAIYAFVPALRATETGAMHVMAKAGRQ